MGYLTYTDKRYTAEQQTHCKRMIADMEAMEVQLYGIIDFMADVKLAPGGISEVADLIKQVRSMKEKFSDDLKRSQGKDY